MTHEYYSSIEECLQHKYKKANTNDRYATFCQTHFTAGDEQQFESKRFKSVSPIQNPIQAQLNLKSWIKFHRLNTLSVSNTFKYIFHKFKKGIFLQIHQGELKTMLPFSKHNYTNEWSDLLSGNPFKVIERSYQIEKREYQSKSINKYTDQWYSNNALIRYEYPIRENDSGVAAIADMFRCLCERYSTELPNLEFFVNKRDHPLFRKDGCEPYDCIFGKQTHLKSHSYDTYAPLFSMCGGDDFADLLIPTWEDWARVCMDRQKYFPKSAQYYRAPFSFDTMDEVEWHHKKPVAVFRGSSTGFGVTEDTNPRIKVARLALQFPECLDAGITTWNARPRIISSESSSIQLRTIDPRLIDSIPIVPFMDITEQAKYKYIVNIDGHVSAYRLSLELRTGSVILKVASQYKIWYSHLLVPYTHYIPVKEDCSDLLDQIQWCQSHDEECRQIAMNARAFYERYLTEDGILEYLKTVLIELKQHTGDYQYHISPSDLLTSAIQIPPLPDQLDPIPISSDSVPFVFHPSMKMRTYEGLQALEWYIRQSPKSFHTNLITNRHSVLNVYTVRDVKILAKEPIEKVSSSTEAMIGMYCINPLLRIIPHFSYTFDYSGKNVYTEYFEGAITLFDYLRMDSFDMKEFCLILTQIAFALDIAQRKCLFMHYDLYPWNILLIESQRPMDYLINPSGLDSVMVQSKYTPIMIDYGKSNGVIEGRYYGHAHLFQFSTIHDILCLLVSSLHVLLNNRTLNKKELYMIFKLSEFFSNTGYTDYKTFQTMKELKQFLMVQKRYSNMLDSKKYELETKTPMDFIRYLQSHHLIQLQNSFIFEWKWRWDSYPITSVFIYNYLCASSETERKQTYLRTIERIRSIPLDSCDLFSYYTYLRILQSIRYWSGDVFDSQLSDAIEYLSPLQYNIQSVHSLPSSPIQSSFSASPQLYDTLFEDTQQVEKYLEYYSYDSSTEEIEEYLENKYFILEYFLHKLANNKSIQSEVQQYSQVLSTNEVATLRTIANRNTFLWLYAKKI